MLSVENPEAVQPLPPSALASHTNCDWASFARETSLAVTDTARPFKHKAYYIAGFLPRTHAKMGGFHEFLWSCPFTSYSLWSHSVLSAAAP